MMIETGIPVSSTGTATAKWDKALVIGGSIAGLLAARVLVEHFAEVLIVERDAYADKPTDRSGTPQATHPHRLLPRGNRILEQFFPGYSDDLLAHGAYARQGKIVRLINPYGSLDILDDKDTGSSRLLLEWVLRQRVLALPNVRWLTRHEVSGLQATPESRRITGVTVRQRGTTGQERTLAADLVIDTSGRSSKLIQWLDALGYAVPEPERLHVSLGYSTRQYKIPDHLLDQWSAILVEGRAEAGIGTGVFSPVERDVAEVALYWAGGDYYPTTVAEAYAEDAAKLLSPALVEMLQQCRPLGAPHGYRLVDCVRQHFEAMTHWPAGLLVLGDAFCTFDPIYGQGMTIAAIEAEILASGLQAQHADPQPDFELGVLAQIQAAIEPAWWLSLVADLRWPGVTYHGPYALPGMRFTQQFFDRYLHQAYDQQDMALVGQYMMMTSLEFSPLGLLNHPTIEAVFAAAPEQLAELLGGQPLDAFLAQQIPTFDHTFAPDASWAELAALAG